jgi:hypothetical protein
LFKPSLDEEGDYFEEENDYRSIAFDRKQPKRAHRQASTETADYSDLSTSPVKLPHVKPAYPLHVTNIDEEEDDEEEEESHEVKEADPLVSESPRSKFVTRGSDLSLPHLESRRSISNSYNDQLFSPEDVNRILRPLYKATNVNVSPAFLQVENQHLRQEITSLKSELQGIKQTMDKLAERFLSPTFVSPSSGVSSSYSTSTELQQNQQPSEQESISMKLISIPPSLRTTTSLRSSLKKGTSDGSNSGSRKQVSINDQRNSLLHFSRLQSLERQSFQDDQANSFN